LAKIKFDKFVEDNFFEIFKKETKDIIEGSFDKEKIVEKVDKIKKEIKKFLGLEETKDSKISLR
jgi:hypothetical protein